MKGVHVAAALIMVSVSVAIVVYPRDPTPKPGAAPVDSERGWLVERSQRERDIALAEMRLADDPSHILWNLARLAKCDTAPQHVGRHTAFITNREIGECLKAAIQRARRDPPARQKTTQP